MPFRPGTKERQKARIALYGPSKSGKTYTGLMLAEAFVPRGDRIAVIDTEHGKSELYADRFPMDIQILGASQHPDEYVRALDEAVAAGYGAVLIDSGSHAWMGKKGILELVDEGTPRGGSSFSTGWNAVRPIESNFWNRLLAIDAHLIMTLRSKQVYEMVEEQGKKPRPRKLGLGPIQRDGLEYEFDILLEMDLDHNATVAGSRYEALDEGGIIPKPDAEFGAAILDMLNQGSEPVKPPDADAQEVEELRRLLVDEEGRDERKFDDAVAARRAENKGSLPPEWVEYEIGRARDRIAERTKATTGKEAKPDAKQDETPEADKANPEPAGA